MLYDLIAYQRMTSPTSGKQILLFLNQTKFKTFHFVFPRSAHEIGKKICTLNYLNKIAIRELCRMQITFKLRFNVIADSKTTA